MVTGIGERLPRPARSPRPARLDVVLAVVCAAAVSVGTVGAAVGQHDIRDLDVSGVLLLAASASAAVGLRRVSPLWGLAATTLLVNGYLLAGYAIGPVLLCLMVAVFEVARQLPLRASAVACGAAAAVSSATIFARVVGEHHATWLLALAWTGWSLLPWSLGALVHVLSAARRRARADLVARTALEERMRIAGEVHDIAGHGFALVTMQAQVALLVFDDQPEQARRSLEAVRDTSSTALADLRRMLDTFHPRPGAPSSGPTTAPTPVLEAGRAAEPAADPAGVTGLADLIGQVRAGGLPVRVAVEAVRGTDGDLPEPLHAAVYRVVQESLTNVLRHAGPTQALVTIDRWEGEVRVRVTDQGRAAPGTVGPPGRGLAGMRRRVEALHGRLEAGPRDGGGFRVEAWLPVPDGPRPGGSRPRSPRPRGPQPRRPRTGGPQPEVTA